MSQGEARERELKLGIGDERAFAALIEAAGGKRAPVALQVNHFFDAPSATLRENAIGFRVREEGGLHILTVKGPTATEADGVLSDRVELESEISGERARAALNGDLAALSLLDDLDSRIHDETGLADTVLRVCADLPPVYIGSFSNERTRVATELAGTPVVLEFDQTSFSAEELRFEVELELGPEQGAAVLAEALHGLFTKAGVEPVPTTSKLARFLEIQDRDRP
jgi:inorganic triphosphatase YgiF